MDDDLGIPEALAILHDATRHGNQALDNNEMTEAATLAQSVRAMLAVLGLDPLDAIWHADAGASATVLDSLVESVLALRWQAKADKDFAQSDALRDVLEGAGIDVFDASTQSTWSIRG